MSDQVKKYFCPRLLDYVILVGPREFHSDSHRKDKSTASGREVNDKPDEIQAANRAQQRPSNGRVPQLLRRYPPDDHEDFALPPDVVIFCQPEGCDQVESSLTAYNNPSQTTNSFVFLLTEKDTSRIRYGICLNFYRPLQKCPPSTRNKNKDKTDRSDSGGPTTNLHQEQEKQQAGDNYSHVSRATEDDQDLVHADQDNGRPDSTSNFDNESGIKMQDSDSAGSSQDRPPHNISTTTRSIVRGGLNYHQTLSPSQTSGREPTSTGESRQHHHHNHQRNSKNSDKIAYALNSICIISHHPFFSTFRECLFIMKKFIQACEDRNSWNFTHGNTIGPSIHPCHCYRQHRRLPNTTKQLNREHSRQSSQQSYGSSSHGSKRSALDGSSSGASNAFVKLPHHHHSCLYSTPIWSLLTMFNVDETILPKGMLQDVAEIEAWILRLISVPVPVPGKTKIELEIMPISLKQPLLFALPDHTRLSLIDFPLHLPLELLGIDTCLQVLTCILLEHKVALQSKDYNALSMSVMAFVTMIYPLEYMFPVIPLLPSFMKSAEQLLLAPTPFIIGFPSSFFKYRSNFTLPNDVWIVDLDANKVVRPPNVDDLPPLPDYEGSILKQNLQKIIDSMSKGPVDVVQDSSQQTVVNSRNSSGGMGGALASQLSKFAQSRQHLQTIESKPNGQTSMPASPFKTRRSSVAAAGQLLQLAANKLSGSSMMMQTTAADRQTNMRSSPHSSQRSSLATPVPTFNPLAAINNDVDAVDVAVRIAMVNFFNSQEVLANFVEHTRTIRLYPRPVVSFQKSSFIQSRTKVSPFLLRLVETQAVEYLAEWALCPDNVAFQRIQTGVYDPSVIGDKPKWYGQQLELLQYQVSDSENREFYEEIASFIRDSSGVSGVASSVGRFSDYYDDTLDKADEEHPDAERVVGGDEDLDENNNNKASTLTVSRPTGIEVGSLASYDINVACSEDSSHSSYISSNIPSPCDKSSRLEANYINNNDDGPKALSLHDVIGMQMRKSSLSSSSSSDESWGNQENRIMIQSVPVNYQQELIQYPPIRCDINKYFRPCNKPIGSLHEARKWRNNGGAFMVTFADANRAEDTDHDDADDFDRKSSFDSTSTDDNDSLRNVQDSSSCDESKTEEFNFESLRPGRLTLADDTNSGGTPTEISGEDGPEVKLFESIDSDTLVATCPSNRKDENNNDNSGEYDPSNLESSAEDQKKSTHNSFDVDDNSSHLASSLSSDDKSHPSAIPPPQTTPNLTPDTMSAMLNSHRMRVSSGVAKLIDRASSIGDPKFRKQGSQSSGSGGIPSPLPKNLSGEQVGAIFDRFTTEARDAVKEALDAGKNAFKPAADVGRQKLFKNLQNLGNNLLDQDRRDSGASVAFADENYQLPTNQSKIMVRESANNSDTNKSKTIGADPIGASVNKLQSKGNEIAGKANSMISGWLGSTASGFASRMRDRARPLGQFPSIDEGSIPACTKSSQCGTKPNAPIPQARRASLAGFRRSSFADIGSGSSILGGSRPQLGLLRNSPLNCTIDESNETDESSSEFFVGQKLVQKSRLIRHSTALNEGPEKPQPIRATQSDSDNQQFLKEVTAGVLKGEGIGWLKFNRLRKLMEDESYRDLVMSQINKNFESRIRPDDRVSDVLVPKLVWRGMLKVCVAIVSGLEQSYMHNKLVGMASVFSLLEVAHTHYWTRSPSDQQTFGGSGAESSQLGSNMRRSLAGSPTNLCPDEATDGKDLGSITSSLGGTRVNDDSSITSTAETGADVESRRSSRVSSDLTQLPNDDSSIAMSKNDLNSIGQDSGTFTDNLRKPQQQTQLQAMWTPAHDLTNLDQTTLANGVSLAPLSDESPRIYLYESLVTPKERSPLWDQIQFWEEAFLDAVSHERCLIGMDQGPGEMLERYKMLFEVDRKRLEHEEDRLLSTLLYNMVAFMLMLRVDHQSIKQKIRRLLGKCHIGLVNSAEINQLLEQIETLKGNDIDLKPMASRQQRRQTFILHKGIDSRGEIIFMEVRDDGLVLRGLDDGIAERWWYERLINMTYSPKNKVVCFWRKSDGQTILNKYYTKKCQELYNCIKESMQRVAMNQGVNRFCSELGGEFPVLDVRSGEGGILQVCMEGVGLLFATSKNFEVSTNYILPYLSI